MAKELFYSIVMLLLLFAIIISCFRRHYKFKCAKKIGETDGNSRSKIIAVVKDIISP